MPALEMLWIGLRPSNRDLLRAAIARRFEEQLRLGLVDVTSLIEARFSLNDAEKAMEYAAQKGVLKVLLDV